MGWFEFVDQGFSGGSCGSMSPAPVQLDSHETTPDGWVFSFPSPTTLKKGTLLFTFRGYIEDRRGRAIPLGTPLEFDLYFHVEHADGTSTSPDGVELFPVRLLNGSRWRYKLEFYHEYDCRLVMSENEILSVYAKITPSVTISDFYTGEELHEYVGEQGEEELMGGYQLVNRSLGLLTPRFNLVNGFGIRETSSGTEMGHLNYDGIANRVLLGKDMGIQGWFCRPEEMVNYAGEGYDAPPARGGYSFAFNSSNFFYSGQGGAFGVEAREGAASIWLSGGTALELTPSGLFLTVNGSRRQL